MPLNEKKVITLILEQCKSIPERCPGYKEELVDILSEILHYERQHSVQGMNIQQKITDKCTATGTFLANSRNQAQGGK